MTPPGLRWVPEEVFQTACEVAYAEYVCAGEYCTGAGLVAEYADLEPEEREVFVVLVEEGAGRKSWHLKEWRQALEVARLV